MTDWLDDLVDEIKIQEDQQLKGREWTQTTLEIMKAKGPDLWTDLKDRLEMAVDRANARFGQERLQMQSSNNGQRATVEWRNHHGIALTVELNLEGHSISYEHRRELPPGMIDSSKPKRAYHRLFLHAANDGTLWLRDASGDLKIDQAVQLLITPVLQGRFD